METLIPEWNQLPVTAVLLKTVVEMKLRWQFSYKDIFTLDYEECGKYYTHFKTDLRVSMFLVTNRYNAYSVSISCIFHLVRFLMKLSQNSNPF